ncbi:MAG: hypothetical protein AB7O59_11610 [Pirellulales bacterium]
MIRLVQPSARLLSRALLAAALGLAAAPSSLRAAQLPSGMELPPAAEAAEAQQSAERNLAAARAAVTEARQAAMAAKAELENAVKATLEQVENAPADAQQQATRAEAELTVAGARSTEIEILQKLIADLQVERARLLDHMTAEHPLIEDANLRLADYKKQLAELERGQPRGANPAAPSARAATPPTAGPQLSSSGASSPDERRQISLRAAEAMVKWEAAQRKLQAAMEAESSHAERLAATAARLSEMALAAADQQETKTAATAPLLPAAPDLPASPQSDPSAPQNSSQPLVLAALVIALVVAAVASIKLARSQSANVFSGADDTAATLSLPVIGVIPAPTPAMAYASVFQRHRTMTFLAQMLLAVIVFAIVAWCVQNPGSMWQFVREPAEVLR